VRDEIARRLSFDLVLAKDEIIKSAITHHLGENWNADQVASRGRIEVLQNKTETFCIDGVQLVSFLPPRLIGKKEFIRGSFLYWTHY
jgi:hypothetical protein